VLNADENALTNAIRDQDGALSTRVIRNWHLRARSTGICATLRGLQRGLRQFRIDGYAWRRRGTRRHSACLGIRGLAPSRMHVFRLQSAGETLRAALKRIALREGSASKRRRPCLADEGSCACDGYELTN